MTKDKTQNLLNMIEQQALEKAAHNDVEFRVQVLTGIAEVKKEVSILGSSTKEQTAELFRRINNVEINGCSKAGIHTDHEERLRYVEKDVAAVTAQSRTNTKKIFAVGGKFLKWEGFTVTDIVMTLAVLILGYVVITKHTDSKKLERLENVVLKIPGGKIP